MAEFKIPVSWSMCGFIYVEADNVYEALKTARKNSDCYELPENGEYIDGSWQIAEDYTPEEILDIYNSHIIAVSESIDDVVAHLLSFSGKSCSPTELAKIKRWITEYYTANQLSLSKLDSFCIQNSEWVLQECENSI